jgi:uncharacterized protein (TIGR02246 family)
MVPSRTPAQGRKAEATDPLPGEDVTPMDAASPEQIHALIAAAFDAGDIDAFLRLHEADATVVVPPDGRQVTGTDAIRAALAPTFALAPTVRIDVVGKVEGDGLALTHARWRLVGTADGEPVEMSGRGTVVSRRHPDGRWRIVLDNPMSPD